MEEEKEYKERFNRQFSEKAKLFIRANLRIKVLEHRIEAAIKKALEGANSWDLVLAIRKPELFCEQCGECCRRSNPIGLTDEDVVAFGELFGENFNQYVEYKEGGIYLKHTQPCIFLQDNNKCRIFQSRPMVCRQFPFMEDNDRIGLGIFAYCEFVENLLKYKALSICMMKELELRDPKLANIIRKREMPNVETRLTLEQEIESAWELFDEVMK